MVARRRFLACSDWIGRDKSVSKNDVATISPVGCGYFVHRIFYNPGFVIYREFQIIHRIRQIIALKIFAFEYCIAAGVSSDNTLRSGSTLFALF